MTRERLKPDNNLKWSEQNQYKTNKMLWTIKFLYSAPLGIHFTYTTESSLYL